jgi:hypothetical protein
MGGGVTTDNAMEYIEAGASHVIVTSFVFREGRLEEERLAQLVSRGSGQHQEHPPSQRSWQPSAMQLLLSVLRASQRHLDAAVRLLKRRHALRAWLLTQWCARSIWLPVPLVMDAGEACRQEAAGAGPEL